MTVDYCQVYIAVTQTTEHLTWRACVIWDSRNTCCGLRQLLVNSVWH